MSLNKLQLTRQDYVGGKSTLCMGCGHDSITNHLISALYQSSVNPYTVAKMSGIGCSSKTTAYFLNRSHGFNAIHGRMAPVATGAKIANHHLHMLGVSGDGDTASIGLGSFAHMIRRNLPIVYIVENNGVYGLTKGQFSAMADAGSTTKNGEANPFVAVDLCSMAIDLGCAFVARSFSGDAKQLVPLLSAALRHPGTALIDVVSPCITFANHEGSTKSYTSVKDHVHPLQELGFIQPQPEIKVDYEEGTQTPIALPDGSTLLLRKLDSTQHDFTNAPETIKMLMESRRSGEILTGLLYYHDQVPSLMDRLHLVPQSLATLDETATRPSAQELKTIMKAFS